jgi:hypothetical protein
VWGGRAENTRTAPRQARRRKLDSTQPAESGERDRVMACAWRIGSYCAEYLEIGAQTAPGLMAKTVNERTSSLHYKTEVPRRLGALRWKTTINVRGGTDRWAILGDRMPRATRGRATASHLLCQPFQGNLDYCSEIVIDGVTSQLSDLALGRLNGLRGSRSTSAQHRPGWQSGISSGQLRQSRCRHVTREEGADRHDPAGFIIPCKRGHIYVHGRELLGVATNGRVNHLAIVAGPPRGVAIVAACSTPPNLIRRATLA